MKTLGEKLQHGYPSNLDSMSNYAGSHEGFDDVHVYTRTRDSNLLDESNWNEALKLLGGENEETGVTIIRHGHWACGWVEYLLVNPRAADKIAIAAQIEKRLKGYPILNDDDFSNRETEARDAYWAQMSISERVELGQKFDIPILQARRNYVPSNDGYLDEWLTIE